MVSNLVIHILKDTFCFFSHRNNYANVKQFFHMIFLSQNLPLHKIRESSIIRKIISNSFILISAVFQHLINEINFSIYELVSKWKERIKYQRRKDGFTLCRASFTTACFWPVGCFFHSGWYFKDIYILKYVIGQIRHI